MKKKLPDRSFFPNRETSKLTMVVKNFLFITLIAIAHLSATAFTGSNFQSIRISGVVSDAVTNEPLPGASIVIQGTTTGVIADINGNYSLDVPGSETVLRVSYVGYIAQMITVGDRRVINISLAADVAALGEFVVVGYGVQRKVNLTGAVSVANREQMEDRPVATVQQALQGLVPNLIIRTTAAGGEPGAEMSMNIRGLTSFVGSSDPYVLIDGIPMGINDINPNDIETITVLKDAASSAIYGARAAYGVILITTKTGKDNRTGVNVSYSTNAALSEPTKYPRMVEHMTFALAMNDAARNARLAPWYNEDALNRLAQNIANPGSAPNMLPRPDGLNWDVANHGLGTAGVTDWWSEIFRDYGNRQQHNLNISGATEHMDYYVSAGFYDERGLLKHGNESFSRYNFDGKIGADATSWAKLSVFFKYRYTEENWPRQHDLGRGRILDWITKLKPTMPLYYPGTEIYTDQSRIMEMYMQREMIYGRQVVVSPRLSLEPIKGWITNIDLNYRQNDDREEFTSKQWYWMRPNGDLVYTPTREGTRYWPRMYQNEYLSPNIYSNFIRSFGNHNLALLAGYQHETYRYFNNITNAFHMISDNIPSVSTTVGESTTVSDQKGHWATQSVFGRINYNFKDKYLFEANVRADGSSRFEPDERWGVFPSVSAGWSISEENFFPLKDQFDLFKIRASYGSLGNQNVANYLYVPTMNISLVNQWLFNGNQLWMVGAPNLTSINLTWEKVNTFGAGLDLVMFNSRLSGSFDVYESYTTNLVGPGQALPAVLGTAVPRENDGEVRTRGYELEMTWRNRTAGGFYYEFTGVFSDNNSVVTKYNNPTKLLNTYYEGQALGEIWGYRTDGLFQSTEEVASHLASTNQSQIFTGAWLPGDVRYLDLNGDGFVNVGNNTFDNPGDRVVLGNTTPRYLFGFNARASWKGFDFSVFVQGIGRADIWMANVVNGSFFRGHANGPLHANVFQEHLDYWRDETSPLGPNPNAYFAKPYAMFTGDNNKNYGPVNDRYLQNAAYVRLKNVQLGYTIPAKISQRVLISRAKIYISGENLASWTKLMLFDPEATAARQGEGKTYPLSRLYSVGLNVNF